MLPRDGVALPNGNFHAGVLTLALDSLRGAMAQSASLIAARVSALLDPEVTGPDAAARAGPGARLRRDDPRVHRARGGRRGPLAGGDRGVADDDRAVGDRVARELRRALRAADVGRAGAHVGRGVRRARARRAGAAAARARAGRARACGGSTRRPRRGWTPRWPTARFPPTSRPRGSSCSRTHCGWTPSGSRVDAQAMRRRDRIDCASDEIHDLEALRAYPWLRELRLRVASPHGSAEHALSDLSPLAELRELEVRRGAALARGGPGAAGGADGPAAAGPVADARQRPAAARRAGAARVAAPGGVAGGGPVAAERPLGAGGARRGGHAGRLARAAARAGAAARARRPRHAGARPHADRRPPRGPRRRCASTSAARGSTTSARCGRRRRWRCCGSAARACATSRRSRRWRRCGRSRWRARR